MSPAKSSRWPRERCSVLAGRRHDPMLGTAFPAARLLLVEQPFPWGPEGLRTSRFDPEVARALEARARTETVRVQAIRRPGTSPPSPSRRWAIVDTRETAATLDTRETAPTLDTPESAPTARWGTYEDDAELLELPLDGSTGEPDEDPLYLVCSHGLHDPCCGQAGHPVVAALAAARPERVWQASHLGGCRFAATVLVLPIGLMYGRVPPSAVPELVAAAEEGVIAESFLRGRIGVPPPAQAALAFAHQQLDLPACRDISLVSTTAVDGSEVSVRIDSRRGPFDVTVERERIDAVELTCGSPGPSWFLAHRAVSIEPVG